MAIWYLELFFSPLAIKIKESCLIEGSQEMLGNQRANVALSFMAGEQMMEA